MQRKQLAGLQKECVLLCKIVISGADALYVYRINIIIPLIS